jgi:hypothetical protein
MGILVNQGLVLTLVSLLQSTPIFWFFYALCFPI